MRDRGVNLPRDVLVYVEDTGEVFLTCLITGAEGWGPDHNYTYHVVLAPTGRTLEDSLIAYANPFLLTDAVKSGLLNPAEEEVAGFKLWRLTIKDHNYIVPALPCDTRYEWNTIGCVMHMPDGWQELLAHARRNAARIGEVLRFGPLRATICPLGGVYLWAVSDAVENHASRKVGLTDAITRWKPGKAQVSVPDLSDWPPELSREWDRVAVLDYVPWD